MDHFDEAFGLFRRKVTPVLVDVNPRLKLRRIRLGVELRGVDILLIADHLKGAGQHTSHQPHALVEYQLFAHPKILFVSLSVLWLGQTLVQTGGNYSWQVTGYFYRAFREE